MMGPRPHERAEVELVEAGLLQKLAPYRLLRRSPPRRSRHPEQPRRADRRSRSRRGGCGRPRRARAPAAATRRRGSVTRRAPEARGTSGGARPRAQPRSPVTSTGGRRARSRRGGAPGARARRDRRTGRCRRSCPRSRVATGASVRAISSSRSAAPAKSDLRRSPEPRVVRRAAFVRPTPYRVSSAASWGSRRRGVNPAACRRRQKSFLGLAKGAPAAALTRPGLMPQKTTRTPGARTSGTALSSCALKTADREPAGST